MSQTKKEGKRTRIPELRGESPEVQAAVLARHTFGSTEKILRRNRKTWTRLVNKRRRAIGKEAVEASAELETG